MNIGWRWMILRGIFGMIFGVLALLWPATALIAVSILFAFYVLIGGALSLAASFDQYRTHRSWGLLLLQGVVGVIAGLAALAFPGIALFSLIVLIGVWALISGVLELTLAFTARESFGHPVWLGLAGLASVFFGVALFAWPLNGVSFLVAFIGAYSFINGLMMVIWGARRKLPRDEGRPLRPAYGV